MRATVVLALPLLLWIAPALGETLVAARPGVMCKSPDALARLTLHDGSSRSEGLLASPPAQRIAQQGGCIDITSGLQVSVLETRRNTSIVTYANGAGPPQRYIVPNIDFTDAAGPHPPAWSEPGYPPLVALDTLLGEVHRQCPRQGWDEHALSHTQTGPWDRVANELTPAQSIAIGKEIDFQCVAGLSCPADIQFGMEVQMGHLPDLVRAICSEPAPAGD